METKESLLEEKKRIERKLKIIEMEEEQNLLLNLEKQAKLIAADFREKFVGNLVEYSQSSSSSELINYMNVENVEAHWFTKTHFSIRLTGQNFSHLKNTNNWSCYIKNRQFLSTDSIRFTYKGKIEGKNSYIKVLTPKEKDEVFKNFTNAIKKTYFM